MILCQTDRQVGAPPSQAADRASRAQLPACCRRVCNGWIPDIRGIVIADVIAEHHVEANPRTVRLNARRDATVAHRMAATVAAVRAESARFGVIRFAPKLCVRESILSVTHRWCETTMLHTKTQVASGNILEFTQRAAQNYLRDTGPLRRCAEPIQRDR